MYLFQYNSNVYIEKRQSVEERYWYVFLIEMDASVTNLYSFYLFSKVTCLRIIELD